MTHQPDPCAEWRSLPSLHRPLTLADTLRPNPESRRKRFAQYSPERLARYLKANEGLI